MISARASDFYVSTNGTAGGDGSINNPWDVYTAFNQPASVKPGDTLWLRGGIYIPENPAWPAIECYLQGTPSAPIIVRQYPGERAIFQEVPYPQYTGVYDQYCLYMQSGGYVWFWDFELRSTNTTRYTSQTGSDPTPTQLPIPNSCEIQAPGVKLINMIIHDCRGGVGMFAGATNSEAYGCLIYNNGWDAPDRGHGHGLYVQNQNGLMTMSDNIIFNQFGLGIHGYTVGSYLQHFLVENNVIFNNGAIAQYPDSNVGEQILFGNVPITDLNIISNYIYQPFGVYSTLLQLDYGLVSNTTGIVANNYIAGGDSSGQFAIYANNYQSMVITGNTVYANGYLLVMLNNASSQSDSNTYYGTSSANFNNNIIACIFSVWQAVTGYDLHSTYNQNATPPNKIIVNPNAFQAKRANIIVYNWANSNSVNVDVSNVLTPGDNYEVINAQNWFGPPVLVGTYNGSPINLPMTNLTTVAPNGWTNSASVPVTGTQFNVFVIIGTNGCIGSVILYGQPTNQTITAGSTATFSAQASGIAPLLYQWQSSIHGGGAWNVLSGATNTTYTTSALTTNDSGTQFRVIVSGTCGSPVTSAVATVTVNAAPVFTSAYAGIIASNSPAAYWRLNETNGATVARDFFGVYNGTIGAGATGGVPGPQNPLFGGFENTNTAIQLSGGSGSALTMSALNMGTNTVTITGWINPNGFQNGWAGIVFCRGATVAGLNFGPGSIANELRYTWNNDRFNTSTGLVVPTNQWSFIALVVTPSGATVCIGTNGVLNLFTDTVNLPSQAFDSSLYLGEDPATGGRFYNGALDEVAVFNHSLTLAQIQQLYSNALAAPPPASTGFQQWQNQYFGSTSAPNTCATCDADGTGQNNLFKYVAGLDPTNPASQFALLIAGVPGRSNQQCLAYSPVVTGRVYTVQFNTDLVNGMYSNLTTIGSLQTNGNQVILTDTNAVQSQKFYRVQITLP